MESYSHIIDPLLYMALFGILGRYLLSISILLRNYSYVNVNQDKREILRDLSSNKDYVAIVRLILSFCSLLFSFAFMYYTIIFFMNIIKWI